jgi:ceramide glucosyltransferase
MAVRRKALESIGGFISLADYLADDYQLGNMIHRAGWRIVLSGDFVESVMQRESLADVLARQLRWCRTMRVSRPSGYLASGITHPFPALLLSIAVAGFLPTFSAAALLYLVRGSMLTFFSRSFIKDNLLPRYLWLLPIRDALSTATWALAFLGNRVRWRGEIYTLKTDGKMARRG